MIKRKNEGFICHSCGCREYDIVKGKSTTTVEDTGETWTVPYYAPVCKKCGTLGYLKYIDDENRKIVAEADRKHFSELLSLKEIKGLPVRYSVPRDAFLAIMDFGEWHDIDGLDNWQAFDLFGGDSPNDEEEKKLKRVKEEPKYFIELLEKAKDRIPKDVYERALKKAESLK